MADKDEEAALVQKYEELLKNGLRARMKIVKEMSVNDRVGIWKTQLGYHLATGNFSRAQNEFILEMMMSLSPATFASRPTEEEGKAIIAKILNVFTRNEGYALFMSIGIHKDVPDAPVQTNNLNPPTCDCLVSCRKDYTCGQPNGCISSPDGCGPWRWLGCHYLCVPA